MLRNDFEGEQTVDAKTAQRALELAVKMQQDQGEQVSINELQRTAAEIGVAPEHVSEALRTIAAEKAAAEQAVSLRQARKKNCVPRCALSRSWPSSCCSRL